MAGIEDRQRNRLALSHVTRAFFSHQGELHLTCRQYFYDAILDSLNLFGLRVCSVCIGLGEGCSHCDELGIVEALVG